jgi:glycosyltransferase involved in cell wall biosynthesis
VITIFVPAYNEAENIRQTVRSIEQAARRAGDIPIEIIVVNDGSRDGTAEVLESMKADTPNDMATDCITLLFRNADRADIVMFYFLNKEIRSVFRNVVSTLFGTIYMVTFGIFVQWITCPCVWPTERLRRIDLKANRYSFNVEATVKLLCSGATYHEVGGYMQTGSAGSNALSLRNLGEVIRSYLRLVYEIRFAGRGKYDKKPRRVIVPLDTAP